jgi:hypothetical protein
MDRTDKLNFPPQHFPTKSIPTERKKKTKTKKMMGWNEN